MLKRFFLCLMISLLMMVVSNSDMFTIDKKVQVMDVYKNGTVRAVYIPVSGKPQDYILHSTKKFGEWEVVKETSTMGDVVMVILLLCIIVIILETTILKPSPYDPYKSLNNESNT